ncbi:MAG TPA: phosphate ABC transporter ATP-binding protein [Thermoflexales bacterium]|nr:phosphate ABC transporter ATP-binding protein [Thermoflexales bacterium]
MSEQVLPPAFALRDVTRRYPGRARPALALGGAFSISRGEMVAVVGPSGAGKSTLLRLMALIEPPSSGELEVFGARADANTIPPLEVRRRVTMVFQRPALQSATAADNVAFGLRIRGQNDPQKVLRALETVQLAHLARAHSRTLSGGEAQRVALARAMAIQPDALLLDEPTANLDPFNVGVIESAIRQMNERDGTTIVLVTHNVFQARRLAHRCVFLLDGAIVEEAETAAFFTTPRDPRTAAFARGEMVC